MVKPGDTFGRLTTKEPIAGGKNWLCTCECGKETKASKWHLEHGKRRSCGCRIKRQTPTCKTCQQEKPRSEFYQRKDGRLQSGHCKQCTIKKMVEKERQDRFKTINHYGGKCACCGETSIEFLSIDHIDGGGNQHRKKENIKNMAKWLKKNNYPTGFRILCRNCNFSYGAYGYCPHQVAPPRLPTKAARRNPHGPPRTSE